LVILRGKREITAPRYKIRDIALFEEIKKALEKGFLFKAMSQQTVDK